MLEDNLRVPSGVSYMLENRKMSMRLMPDALAASIEPVAHYPDLLLDNLREVAPHGGDAPTVVVLTPGMYNSAYFEHAFLAQQMGVELVEGQDLFVEQNTVYMRTTQGPRKVDVIYRRLDDDFLDPLSFRADSALGVPGLLSVYRAGRVTLANAIGTGIADDKSTYLYVPDMIRFYLGQEPILSNVPTARAADELSHVLDRMHELVVKEVHGAGGYGMLVGPSATRAEVEAFDRVRANPCQLHRPADAGAVHRAHLCESGVAPRHVDLRPYVLCGKDIRTVPGGLPRGADRRLAGGQQQPGRRHQGYVGTGGLNHAEPNRRQPVLMCRYTERAENTARMLDVNLQMSRCRRTRRRARARGWPCCASPSCRACTAPGTPPSAARRAALHGARRRQSSSIYSACTPPRDARRARQPDHRGLGNLQHHLAGTAEAHTGLLERNPGEFFEWMKFRSHLARGVTIGTMLEDEALFHAHRHAPGTRRQHRAHAGREVPRTRRQRPRRRGAQRRRRAADGRAKRVTAGRRCSARCRAWRSTARSYRDVITPDRVAELLILRPDMPRSLLAAIHSLSDDLARVANQRSAETQRRAGMLRAELQYGRVEDILASGLHQYLEHFLDRINDLGNRISQDSWCPCRRRSAA